MSLEVPPEHKKSSTMSRRQQLAAGSGILSKLACEHPSTKLQIFWRQTFALTVSRRPALAPDRGHLKQASLQHIENGKKPKMHYKVFPNSTITPQV